MRIDCCLSMTAICFVKTAHLLETLVDFGIRIKFTLNCILIKSEIQIDDETNVLTLKEFFKVMLQTQSCRRRLKVGFLKFPLIYTAN